jgi:hypothetical protein
VNGQWRYKTRQIVTGRNENHRLKAVAPVNGL